MTKSLLFAMKYTFSQNKDEAMEGKQDLHQTAADLKCPLSNLI